MTHTHARGDRPPIESSRVARVRPRRRRARGLHTPRTDHDSPCTSPVPRVYLPPPSSHDSRIQAHPPHRRHPLIRPVSPASSSSPRARPFAPHTSSSRARDLPLSCSPTRFPPPRSPLARAPRASRSSSPPRRDRRRPERLRRDASPSSPRDAGTRTRTVSSPRSFASLATSSG